MFNLFVSISTSRSEFAFSPALDELDAPTCTLFLFLLVVVLVLSALSMGSEGLYFLITGFFFSLFCRCSGYTWTFCIRAYYTRVCQSRLCSIDGFELAVGLDLADADPPHGIYPGTYGWLPPWSTAYIGLSSRSSCLRTQSVSIPPETP